MRSVHLDREAAADARGWKTTHPSGVSLAGGALLSGFQGGCTGRRVLPSANVPRPSGTSFIARRGVPDALRTMSAAARLVVRLLRRDGRWACGGEPLSFRGRRAVGKQKSEGRELAAVDIDMTVFNVRVRLVAGVRLTLQVVRSRRN
jgi:hypothetical protein